MSDMHKEQISSLLDSELNHSETSELLKAFESDDGLNKQFDRYALIREALNEDAAVHEVSFLKGVQDALVEEPTVLAPAHEKDENNIYLTVALAATVVIFTVVMFDIGIFTDATQAQHSVASIEAEQNNMLALEKLQREEALQDELPRAQLVTFEK